jgi:hypothetical protein
MREAGAPHAVRHAERLDPVFPNLPRRSFQHTLTAFCFLRLRVAHFRHPS